MAFNDDFEDAGQLANYTNVDGAAWSISGGKLVAPQTAPVNACMTRDGFAPDWPTIETEIDTSADCGLVTRFVDTNNHYLLALRDDTGNATLNCTLYRKASGTYNQLANVNLTWPRGATQHFLWRLYGNLAGHQFHDVFCNGQLIIDAVRDDTYQDALPVGVRSFNAPAAFHWLAARETVLEAINVLAGFEIGGGGGGGDGGTIGYPIG